MLNTLRNANVSKALRWSILAWVMVFACSQAIASSHIHVDSHSDESCIICTHADNTPVLGAGEFVKVLELSDYHIPLSASDLWVSLSAPSSYLTRAPPQV